MTSTDEFSTFTKTPASPTPTKIQVPVQSLRDTQTPAIILGRATTNTVTPTQIQTQTSSPEPITLTLVPTSQDDLFSDRLLPDLQTLPPTDLRLLYNPDSGRVLIRFTNSIWNSGPGKLELIGIPNQSNDQFQVSQRIFSADSELFDEYKVGEFMFNDQHNHWHLEQFAKYEVWSVDEKGALETMVSSGEKVSWCVIDETLAEPVVPDEVISTRPSYFNCDGKMQGLSVGWVDIYEYYLPRQWVEVTSLEDGIYALVSIVNPDHLLLEEDVDNNTGLVYFEIRELRLKLLEEQIFEYENDLIPNSIQALIK